MGKDLPVSDRQDDVRQLVMLPDQVQLRKGRPRVLLGRVRHPGWRRCSFHPEQVVNVADVGRRILRHVAERPDEGRAPGTRAPRGRMAVRQVQNF